MNQIQVKEFIDWHINNMKELYSKHRFDKTVIIVNALKSYFKLRLFDLNGVSMRIQLDENELYLKSQDKSIKSIIYDNDEIILELYNSDISIYMTGLKADEAMMIANYIKKDVKK